MNKVRLLMVQFGDYYTALKGRRDGSPETYRAQYYSLDAVDTFLDGAPCMVLCLDVAEQEHFMDSYHIIGGRFMPTGRGLMYYLQARESAKHLISVAKEYAPTHIIIRTPGWVLSVLGRWALQKNIHLLPVLADYYPYRSWRDKVRRMREIAVLQKTQIPLVANHNYPACQTLVAAGVSAEKIVPWDWPAQQTPRDFPEKQINAVQSRFRILYAGLLLHSKGVGDVIKALASARDDLRSVHMDVCGEGPDKAELESFVQHNGLERQVVFHGHVSNQQVVDLMHRAHAVVVPSRPEYPEGLPNVIYESFETRTPLICSDHPSFMGRLHGGTGCFVYPAGNISALAKALSSIQQPDTYSALSASTIDAWDRIQCPVTFSDVLLQWKQWTLNGTPIPCLDYSLGSSSSHGGRS